MGSFQAYSKMGNTGYTSSDIMAVFRMPDYMDIEPTVFGQLNTISYSTYRDKFPVRALGSTRAKGYTKGSRTVAGQLSFMILNKPVINDFAMRLYDEKMHKNLSVLPDELPPFSIDINFHNERGDKSRISLIGVEIAEGNQVISTEQMQTSEQYSFVAQDIIQLDLQNFRNEGYDPSENRIDYRDPSIHDGGVQFG